MIRTITLALLSLSLTFCATTTTATTPAPSFSDPYTVAVHRSVYHDWTALLDKEGIVHEDGQPDLYGMIQVTAERADWARVWREEKERARRIDANFADPVTVRLHHAWVAYLKATGVHHAAGPQDEYGRHLVTFERADRERLRTVSRATRDLVLEASHSGNIENRPHFTKREE